MEDYLIIKKIGSGSFATVYLAQKDQELYALKVINKTEITAVYEQKLNNEIHILKVYIFTMTYINMNIYIFTII